MNCLEVRHLLLENPLRDESDLQEHVQQCLTCQAFAVELKRQEAQLRQALAVPVPPHLTERVLLATRLRRPRWQPYALAASVLLVVMLGIGGYLTQRGQTPAAWSEVVLAHVLNERSTLEKDERVSHARLAAALAGFGLTPKGDLGRIRYLDRCEMPGGKGLHVVIDTLKLGQVTLILPPRGTRIRQGHSARDGFAAQLMTIGNTSIGIVTEHPDQLEPLGRWLSLELKSLPT